MPVAETPITPDDLALLERAYDALEHPSFAARVSSVIGSPVEQALTLLPKAWSARLHRAAEGAIGRALGVAIGSLGSTPPAGTHDDLHRLLALGTGAVGGFFGMPALIVELPVTTIVMLRAIADIAHAAGEDLTTAEARLACLEVFAVGGRSAEDDYTEIGYYEVRAGLALHLSRAIKSIAEHGASAQTLPATAKLVQAITGRFGLVLTDKAAAQMVPLLGAIGGSLINTVFMEHFQTVARGHFTVRRLERCYGTAAVAEAYAGFGRRDAVSPAAGGVTTGGRPAR
jgi:hypothetical protein